MTSKGPFQPKAFYDSMNYMSKDAFCFTFSVKKGMEKEQVKMGRSGCY